MYFTDRGIEELDDRRGVEQVTIGWLAERLRDFVDDHPESEATIDSLASWLARLDEEDYEDAEGGIPEGASARAAAAAEDDEFAAEEEDLSDLDE